MLKAARIWFRSFLVVSCGLSDSKCGLDVPDPRMELFRNSNGFMRHEIRDRCRAIADKVSPRCGVSLKLWNCGMLRSEEFKQSFDMFDTDRTGEVAAGWQVSLCMKAPIVEQVDVIQVGGILRSLGFATELAEVQAHPLQCLSIAAELSGRCLSLHLMLLGAPEDGGLESWHSLVETDTALYMLFLHWPHLQGMAATHLLHS